MKPSRPKCGAAGLLRTARCLSLAIAAVLAACGGGSSDTAPDSLLQPDAQQLEGAACPDCRPGRLQGQAAIGGALAHAAIRVLDSQGRVVEGRTDALGRFDMEVAGLAGPLLLQVVGDAAGLPVRLHSACRAAEVGARAVSVTPLTELMVAQVLGGRPADLLREGRTDFARIGAEALRQAEQAVEALVRPVLDAAGVAPQVDLRLSPFPPDHRGLDAALDLLDLSPSESGYLLRHVAMPGSAARLVLPGRLDDHTPLPAPPAGSAAAALLLPALQQHLDEWTALFAGGLPDAAVLRIRLAPGFLDAGLDAEAFIAQVLLRDDPPDQGGFSLRGATWRGARLVSLAGDGRVQLRFAVQPVGAALPQVETQWLQPHGSGWRWQGDGAAARVAVHNLAVLGPRPLDLASLQARPGVQCPGSFERLPSSTIDQRCRVVGGQLGLPAGGVLDLGQPGEELFGVLAEFRQAHEVPAARLAAYRQHSTLLAAPSQQVERFLLLALDARRVHPLAAKAWVTGPGLPVAGLALHPPRRVAGRPVSDHWAFADDGAGDAHWHGVRVGWCDAAVDEAEARSCALAWSDLRAGARYRWQLSDDLGRPLGAVEAVLTDAPGDAATLLQRQAALFPRFELAALPGQQPALATLLAAPAESEADALALDWPWRAPGDKGQRLLDVQWAWWRSPYAASAASGASPTSPEGDEVLRQRQPLAAADSGRALVAWPARAGWRGRWLVGQITAVDALGNRYQHTLMPGNPL